MKLSEAHVEVGWNIPKDLQAKAAHPCSLASCMGKSYSKDTAMDIVIGLFEEINQRDLAEKVKDEQGRLHAKRIGSFYRHQLAERQVDFYDQMALSFCIRHWPGLGCVTLWGCSFHQQDPEEELATSLPRLQWCQLSESCCVELDEHPSLAQLELGDGTLGDAGMRLLCKGLQQPNCHLRVLSASCEDLTTMLGTSPYLEELDLSFSKGLRDASVKLLCKGLQCWTCQLRLLWLGSCQLTGACCQALAARLVESPGLTCLNLSNNELGVDGVLQLRQQLQHSTYPLWVLGLSMSELNEEALQELALLRMLKPNLKIGYLLEQDVPQARAMVRLPFYRGVPPGGAEVQQAESCSPSVGEVPATTRAVSNPGLEVEEEPPWV